MNFHIRGGRALLPEGVLGPADLQVADGLITAVGEARSAPLTQTIDARGLLVLPGLVDIHGDAFERQIMPRPGVQFPLELALADTDAQLLAHGITTAFHAVTCSWEPGLRSVATLQSLLDALDLTRPWLRADHRIHLRWEAHDLDHVETVIDWLARGKAHILAFNDHAPEIALKAGLPDGLAKYADRSGITAADYRALLDRVMANEDAVRPAIERVAEAAREFGVPILAHDEDRPEQRRWYNGLGSRVCEFPTNEATARAARDLDDAVVMGAPNVVRGGSHNRKASAATFVRDGLATVLASDYHYPSLLYAPFRLAATGTCGLGDAWRLVSTNPAAATGLADRGTLEVGRRADIVLVDAAGRGLPRVVATFVAGRPVFASQALAA